MAQAYILSSMHLLIRYKLAFDYTIARSFGQTSNPKLVYTLFPVSTDRFAYKYNLVKIRCVRSIHYIRHMTENYCAINTCV